MHVWLLVIPKTKRPQHEAQGSEGGGRGEGRERRRGRAGRAAERGGGGDGRNGRTRTQAAAAAGSEGREGQKPKQTSVVRATSANGSFKRHALVRPILLQADVLADILATGCDRPLRLASVQASRFASIRLSSSSSDSFSKR